jgi:hypothetical protein
MRTIMASWAQQQKLLGEQMVRWRLAESGKASTLQGGVIGRQAAVIINIIPSSHSINAMNPAPLRSGNRRQAAVMYLDRGGCWCGNQIAFVLLPAMPVCMQERNAQLAETTAKLQEEKLRLDALLVRQYNLVAVLGRAAAGSGKDNGGSVGSPDNSSASREGLTLGRWLLGWNGL